MIFYVSGQAIITFTQRVEAETPEEADKKVMEMNAVDLTWDSEEINIVTVAPQAERT